MVDREVLALIEMNERRWKMEQAAEAQALRDQFAMAALTGLCANPDYKANKDKFAVTAYELAEEMLAARGGK